MNFDTGVISTSSLSIGAWASAAPEARATRTMTRTVSAIFLMSRSLGVVINPTSALNTGPGAGPRALSFRPAFRALDGATPPMVACRAGGLVHRRRERALDGHALGNHVERAPHPRSQAGQIGGAERGRLDHRRPQHRDVHDVRLKLTEKVVRHRPAVHAQLPHGDGGVRRHRFQHVAALEAIAYQSRRSEEHTSELQSRPHLVCRLLLEKKKTTNPRSRTSKWPLRAAPS